MGFMMWWFSRLPHFDCIDDKDGQLNNWWHYIADFEEAQAWEDSLSQLVCDPNGVFEEIENSQVRIYPNPSNGFIQIESDEDIDNIFIYDTKGRLVKKLSFQTSLDVRDMNGGMYILECKKEGKIIHREKLFFTK